MKPTLPSIAIIASAIAVATAGALAGTTQMKDRTQYDCRVVVGYKMERIGKGNIQVRRPIFACPHKELMAAGKCEVNWLGQMRCKE